MPIAKEGEQELTDLINTMIAVKGQGHAKFVTALFSLTNMAGVCEMSALLAGQAFGGMAEMCNMSESDYKDILNDYITLVNKQNEYIQGKDNGLTST